MPAADLWDIGQATLDAVVAAYAAEGIALPSRQYVAVGSPVDDCEQLVVWLGAVGNGLPAGPVSAPERAGMARFVQVNARISRCVVTVDDNGLGPTSAQIEASSEDIATDLWVLPQGLIAQHAAGTWLDQCQDIVMGTCVPFDWSGGVGGVELAMSVQVDSSL